MDSEREDKRAATKDAARRRLSIQNHKRAVCRERAISSLKRQLERVSSLERQLTGDDQQPGSPSLVPAELRAQFNTTLRALAEAGADTAGLYMPPGRSAWPSGDADPSLTMIRAALVRRHLERALERLDAVNLDSGTSDPAANAGGASNMSGRQHPDSHPQTS